jgi:hypothetical protein
MKQLVRITLDKTTNRPISWRHITDDKVIFPDTPDTATESHIDVTLAQFFNAPADVNYSYWKVESMKDITEMSDVEKDDVDAQLKKIRDDNEITKREQIKDRIGGSKTDVNIKTEVETVSFNRLKPDDIPPKVSNYTDPWS